MLDRLLHQDPLRLAHRTEVEGVYNVLVPRPPLPFLIMYAALPRTRANLSEHVLEHVCVDGDH